MISVIKGYPVLQSKLLITTLNIRIFNIRHKIAGNRSVSIKNPLFITEYSLNNTDSNFWEQIYNFC